MKELWTVSDVAKRTNVAAATVRLWIRRGALSPDAITPAGIRLFSPRRILALAQRRARARARARVVPRAAKEVQP
jgi:DNA-binding transcriptional MerR regulator